MPPAAIPSSGTHLRGGALVVLLSAFTVGGCAQLPPQPSRAVAPAAASRAPDATELPGPAGANPVPRPAQLYPGSGKLVAEPPIPARARAARDGIQLQFVDTEIGTIVASVIGEGLGAPYVVDPAVKGTLTLQSSRPLATAELVPALEAALQAQGLALTNADGTYHVVPLKEAARAIRGLRGPASKGQPGYGIQIVPLSYIGAAEMQRTLEPFAPPGGIVRVDESRNLLLLGGTSQELGLMLDVVQTFDVDWLAGMSFGLFNANYVDARTLAGELAEIFADPRSPLSGVVRLVPIARLNAILAVTSQAHYLTEVESWVKRLDLGGSAPGRRIFVYDVQNARASDLAKSLNRILSLTAVDPGEGSGGAPTLSTPTSAFAASPAGNAPRALGQSSVGFAGGAARAPGSNALQSPSGGTAIDTGGIRIVPNDENNSLLILASPGEFGVIEAALKRLDQPARQVLIEATLVEVTLTEQLQYGVQWAYQSSKGPVVLSQSSGGGVAQQFPGFSYLYNGSANISAVLNALESVSKVRVLSNPKLMVLNNREAQIQVGDQVPVIVQSAITVTTPGSPIVNSVQLMDTGVILRVTPRVNQNGLVQLDITQEVSDVVKTTTSGIDSPTIQQRKLTSTVSVKTGDTIALGGLIRETVTKSKSGVPLLARIPVLGALFGNVDNSKDRTELIVLITPRVVRDEDELHQAMESLRQQFPALPALPPAKSGT